MARITKSHGVTGTESRLAKLAEETFLRLWSFPNLYRDQKTGGTGSGKELCDLLVIFEETAIIFSDKKVRFSSGDVSVAWRRWLRRAVFKAHDQLLGAERWILEHPDRIFLDSDCKSKFPHDLRIVKHIHHIIVAHGACEACKAHFPGSSGSLPQRSDLVAEQHFDPLHPNALPFFIGRIDRDRIIHVFDEVALPLILQCADTISDFLDYLKNRTALLNSAKTVLIPGEENLLALYLMPLDEPYKDILRQVERQGADLDCIYVSENLWDILIKNRAFFDHFEKLRQSYVWDQYIDLFAKNVAEENLDYSFGILTFNEYEIGLRLMAKETRYSRLILATGLREIATKADPSIRTARIMIPPRPDNNSEIAFVFIQHPYDDDYRDYADYRNWRQTVVAAYCTTLLSEIPGLRLAVGIATEPMKVPPGRSEDLVMVERKDGVFLSEEEVQKMRKDFNIQWSREELLKMIGQAKARDNPARKRRPRKKK